MKQLRVGIIGLGFAGRLHCEGYQSVGERARIVAVCDRNKKKARSQAEEFGAETCSDYRELVRRKDIDAVDICLPHHLHARVAVEAAQAGKHILVEKPIATTIEDADRIIAAAKRASVTLMVAENHLFKPAHRKIKEIIDSGEIGRVFLVRAFEGTVSELTLNPNPRDWRGTRENQGVLLDMGVHKFALLRWLLGDIDSVFALREKLVVTELAPHYDDTSMVSVKFRSGAVAEVVVTSGLVGGDTNSLEIYGTQGTILENHRWDKPVMYMSRRTSMDMGRWIWPEWVWPEVEHAPFPGYYNISFKNEVKHFVDCVLKNKRPEMTGEDAREALRVAIAATKSAKENRMIKLQPE
jgi:predicted dehydrogenase